MKQLIYLAIILIVLLSIGCAMQPSQTNITQQATTTEEISKADLPDSLNLNIDEARPAVNVYRELDPQKVVQNFNPVILKDISAKTQFFGVFLSRCDIDVIRAMVASGWTPSVVIQTPGGQKHVRIVIGYNDPPKRIALVDFKDPARLIQLDEGYDDFMKQWDNKTCVVFDRNVSESSVKLALRKYLPSEKVSSIGITARVK